MGHPQAKSYSSSPSTHAAVSSGSVPSTHVSLSASTPNVCRRDGKAITLSHDALLVALVSTAPHVKQAADSKLQPISVELALAPDNTVRLSLSPSKPASTAGSPPAEQDAADNAAAEADSTGLQQADSAKASEDNGSSDDADAMSTDDAEAVSGSDADDTVKVSSEAAAVSTQMTKDAKAETGTKACNATGGKQAGPYAPGAGKRSDLTFLDPMNKADCPPKAIALAAGELVLRIREERRRRKAGGLNGRSLLPSVQMSGNSPGRPFIHRCACFETAMHDSNVMYACPAAYP